MAGLGLTGQGWARQARLGGAQRSKAGPGTAGLVRRGWAWHVPARHDAVRQERHGEVGPVLAEIGWVRPGRLGKV
jgi:hypothetical protein